MTFEMPKLLFAIELQDSEFGFDSLANAIVIVS